MFKFPNCPQHEPRYDNVLATLGTPLSLKRFTESTKLTRWIVVNKSRIKQYIEIYWSTVLSLCVFDGFSGKHSFVNINFGLETAHWVRLWLVAVQWSKSTNYATGTMMFTERLNLVIREFWAVYITCVCQIITQHWKCYDFKMHHGLFYLGLLSLTWINFNPNMHK